MTTPLHQLNELGQAVWLDSISRDWLDDGELERMLDRLAIVGVTSNPSIFAIALRSDTYDDDIERFLNDGLDDRSIFERLAVDDIRRACDVLAAVHERTNGLDGLVSIELEPDLAHDADASVERARQLWAAVGRPNLLIKVPATEAGIPVIGQLVREGINVNVTLLFSVGVYRRVMEQYITALEQRLEAGESLDVASVASFFVSRVDTKVDPLLQVLGDAGVALCGKVAVANAVAAWAAYLEVFTSGRWMALQRAGARPQRPLWASTGTKNPSYSDVLYVQELIAPGTVNTMPLATLEAFADHGRAMLTVDDTASALTLLEKLAGLGIDLDAVTEQLRAEGVEAFEASYAELLERIGSKRAELSRA